MISEEELLARFERVERQRDDDWLVRCRAHDDGRPSLHITLAKDRWLLKCLAGCSFDAVCDAHDIRQADLFQSNGNGNGSVIEATYDYVDETGRLLYQAVRKPGKRFSQRRPDGNGGWIYKLADTRRVLYHLPQVVAAVAAGQTIYVVEGEKDVHALERIGLVATCNAMGAGKWRPDYSEALAGARAVIVPDCDKPGREHAKLAAASLTAVAASVRVLDIEPGRDDGYDVSDYAADAVTDVDRAELRRCIVGAAESVKPFTTTPAPGVASHPAPLGGGQLATPRDLALRLASEGGHLVGHPGHPGKLRVVDVDRMLTTDPPPVPWTVEPLLAEGCVTMLAGREGQGKSMLASAIGHGATVAGLACRGGRVLYVDAENGEREAHRRVRGLCVKRGMLTYVEANGFSLSTDVELLAKLVDEHHPAVLVLDSLRSLAPGLDENDSRPVEAALRPVSRLAQDKTIPVLLLHHAGKQGTEYRGSTAIGAAVEIGFTLSRREEDPEKRTRRRLACWKSRPAPEPEPRWITLEARGADLHRRGVGVRG